MKIFNRAIVEILLIIVLILIFLLIGCGEKGKDIKPTSLRHVVVEKIVVVGCDIPKIECDFKGESLGPTIKLLECIKKQKEALRICTETNYEYNKNVNKEQ